jgi:hypothetical protein
LTYCDMTTSPTGQAVCFANRVEEICSRYGEGHLVSVSMRLAEPDLAAMVGRTEQLLRSR